ncbi:hypothetical protein JXJ21_14985 [candidate division KSB1 bacterium]|nr:hypothetical protein [candidate division KSB1 bacterium]
MNQLTRLIFILVLLSFIACSSPQPTLFGTWEHISEKSTDIVTWRYREIEVSITKDENRITILHNWLQKQQVAYMDSMSFVPGKEASPIPVTSAIWSENWYMGVLSKPGSQRMVSGDWVEHKRALTTRVVQTVEVSQGDAVIETLRDYRLDATGDTLTIVEKRSTRQTPITLVFEKI